MYVSISVFLSLSFISFLLYFSYKYKQIIAIGPNGTLCHNFARTEKVPEVVFKCDFK